MRLSLAAALLLLASCEGSDSLTALRPELSVSESNFDFGEVPLGASRRLRFEVRNQGAAPLHLDTVTSSVPFALWGLGTEPLPSGTARSVDVVFTPDSIEPASRTVELGSDGGSEELNLRGRGVSGLASAYPQRVDLSEVPVGTRRTAEASFENAGEVPISGRLVLEAATFAGFFAVQGAELGEQLTLPPRGGVTLGLHYAPLEPGRHPAVLRFETCEGRCGVEVEIEASGVEPAMVLEPSGLDFGEVGVGETSALILRVTNEGAIGQELSEVRAIGPMSLTAEAQTNLPVMLAPGDSVGVEVRFHPEAPMQLSGVVELIAKDVAYPLAAAVRGAALGPNFVVQPPRIHMGTLLEPTRTQRAIVAVNAGSAPLRLLSVVIEGDPELSLGPVPGAGVRLGPGESFPVQVSFEPTRLGAYTATVSLQADDPNNPRVEVPIVAGLGERSCQLEVRPEVVDFGLVVPGYHRDRTVRLRNGGEPCQILSAELRSGGARLSLTSLEPLPKTLALGEELVVGLRFAPTEAMPAKDTLLLRTDEPVLPYRSVALRGTGLAYPDLEVRPEVLDFGGVRPECPREERWVDLLNVGTTPITLAGATLEDADETFDLVGGGGGVSIAPGQRHRVVVGFDPVVEGASSGNLVVAPVDLPHEVVVPVRGQGDPNPRVEERFEQPPKAEVDVLFVVDDSCSMADEQSALARNFGRFIQQASLRNVDFHIGITTTTVIGVGGNLVGPWLDAGTADLATSFASQVNVGIRGSGIEMGLEAIRGALLRDQRRLGANRGLFRGGSEHYFILVSDEDDASPASVVSYASELRRRLTQVEVIVIGGGKEGCVSATNLAYPAPRYDQFVDELRGQSLSLCNDWGQTLSAVGNQVFGLGTRFGLDRTPDEAYPIEVFLDGQLTSSGYSIEGRTLVISTPPPPGTEIRIEYTPACGG